MDFSTFRVKKYAQTDEESVLRNILDTLGEVPKSLVDIGAGADATYSNTQLFIDEGWLSCRFDLRSSDENHAKPVRITAGNVVGLLLENGVPVSFGILSLDIDGIDLYVLDAVLRGGFRPEIIVYEFNGCRNPGSFDAISYDENFNYASDDYYGASWSAFQHVLGLHGYISIHQSSCMNGYAVSTKRALPGCDSPVKNQYHIPTQRTDVRWVDCRLVISNA